MALTLKHHELETPIVQMLQGVTCLIAYKDSIQNRDCYEAEFVIAACEIINSHLGRRDYAVVMEYPYRNIVGRKTRQEADIVVIKKSDDNKEKGEVICVLEFKMSTDTNGGVYKDVNKLRMVPKEIDCLSILLFLKPDIELRKQFVSDRYYGRKGPITLQKNKYLEQATDVKVRRVTKVLRSIKSTREPYMAVCIEV